MELINIFVTFGCARVVVLFSALAEKRVVDIFFP